LEKTPKKRHLANDVRVAVDDLLLEVDVVAVDEDFNRRLLLVIQFSSPFCFPGK
jgi:hypothetical protein